MNGRIKRNEPLEGKLTLPIVGKLRIGIKENNYPKSVDYFVPTGKYKELFTKVYGNKPQSIQIIFPSNEANLVCNERYEYRDDKGQLISYGNGDEFKCWNGKEYITCNIDEYPNLMTGISNKYPNSKVKKGEDGWDVILTLIFIVPMVQGVAGFWQFSTKGRASSINNIRNTYDQMLLSNGKVSGILFDLNVEFAKSQKPDSFSKFPVVSLVPNENEENINKVKDLINLKQIGE